MVVENLARCLRSTWLTDPVPTIAFPRRHLVSLQDLASRALQRCGARGDNEALARDLLSGFFDVCMRAGLDRVLVEIEQAFAPLDVADGAALSDDPRLRSDLVAKLGIKSDFDPGGPRNTLPRQLSDCLIAVFSLALSDPPDRTITLSGELRGEVTAALASVVDVELALPQMRDAIIATGRDLCDARYLGAFERISAQLDERGMRIPPQPRMPLDAVQAVQRVLFDARTSVVERAAHAAIDRAKQAVARVSAEAAARIDLPITHRLTPREVAIRRASETHVPKVPEAIVHSLFESLTDLSELVWGPAERPVRAYAASQTFTVGDLLEHPKFGRGTVQSATTERIDVEFSQGSRTLVHARAAK